MELEKFVSGYCRQLDSARTVEVLLRDSTLEEADCCYGNCLYQASCPIAKEIDTLIEK